MERIKGAIFDLDGTLLDSMNVWERIDIDFLAKRGLAVPEDYIEAVTPLGFYDAAVYTIGRFQLKETPQALIEEWSAMAAYAYGNTVSLKPHAKAYLTQLRQRGVRLAVATALSEELYVPALKNNGIYGWFDAFTTLNECGGRKGEPKIYRRAAKKLGLDPSDCAVFEDILEGIEGANAGGFITVGVADFYSRSDRERILEKADYYIDCFSDLLEKP